jgi:PAS domain-containing protein
VPRPDPAHWQPSPVSTTQHLSGSPGSRGEQAAGRPRGRAVSEHPAPTLRPAALSGLLDALPDGVLAVDRAWTIAYVNPAGAALCSGRSVS